MRLSLRYIIPLPVVLAGITYLILPLVDQLTLNWFVRDLNIRSPLIASALQEPLQQNLSEDSRKKTLAYFNRIMPDERLFALGLCTADDFTVIATKAFPDSICCDDLREVTSPPTTCWTPSKACCTSRFNPCATTSNPWVRWSWFTT